MNKRLYVPLFCLLVLASGCSSTYETGGESANDDLARVDETQPFDFWIGLGPGAEFFQHQGSFSSACDCEFSDQQGMRVTFAAEFRMEFPKHGFGWSILGGYSDASADFVREETRSGTIVTGEPSPELDFRKTAHVQLRWMRINPGVFWFVPSTRLFIRGGVDIGLPIEYRYDQIEQMLSEGYTYLDGSRIRTLLAEQDIPGGDKLRFALTAGIGYDFFLTPSIAITPRLGASIPLTAVSSTDESWSVLTAYGLLMINLRL